MISESTIERIKAVARIQDFCTDTAKAYGQNKLFCECPACHYRNDKKKQGLTIDTKNNTAHCFSPDCGVHYSGAIDFVMKTTNCDYPAALQFCAKQYGIFIEETAERKPQTGKVKSKKTATPTKPASTGSAADATIIVEPVPESVEGKPSGIKSFCDNQLAESGLTYDDVRVETYDEKGTTRFISPFCQGTRDQFGNFLEQKGDDVLIKYFDLDGKPVMYKPERATNMRPLIRVRWQNPAAHPDKDGNPIKYQSPAGSGSHVYIPEALRRMYKHARKIKRLFVQEGEKKAEKSCKHGIMSVGIMGINNLATDGRLPDEIQLIVQRCDVDEVVFVLDSDWRNLSEKLENGKSVDTRPRQFFAAVRSFKEYLRTLSNLGSPVEIYFSYIKFNDAKAKGIDDLLVAFPELAIPEREAVEGSKVYNLSADFDHAINEKSGSGKFVQVNKITMLPDDKIADFWMLNDAEKFADYHKNRLKDLKEFKIKGYLRRFNEKGVMEMAQQLFPDEKFWDEIEKADREGNITTTLKFRYVRAMRFFQNRGFSRFAMRSGEKILIFTEERKIREVDHTEFKDFIKSFCFEIKREDVLELLMCGGPQYLGPEKLTNLEVKNLPIERAYSQSQDLFFRDKIWEISAQGIKELNYGQFTEYVWNEKIIKHDAKALPAMIDVTVMTNELRKQFTEEYKDIPNGEFFIDYSADALNCHFLKFLMNCSNFNWRKDRERRAKDEKNPDREITAQERREIIEEQFLNSRHLINKLTSIGYLLHDFKDDNELKAIIAVDGKISEVGSSNGRSGKSLVGKAIRQMIPQVTIDGKNKKLDDDNFRYNDVTEKTKNLFFDDVRANFDFESLFSVITDGMIVNQKSGRRFGLRPDETPKIIITTNHALNGSGSSFTDRQSYMVFYDFYNDDHKPVHDFGCAFFSEWDADQWNLFYNLMATCLMLYFKSKQLGWSGTKRIGIVPPPMDDVEKRKLRQTMGENFLTWADAYFHWDAKNKAGNLNTRHVRKELYDDFLNENPMERKYCTPARFKEKTLAFCQYSGLDFNPKQRNEKGSDFQQFKRTNPETPFIGKDDKTGGKEYFTLANKDFNEAFQ